MDLGMTQKEAAHRIGADQWTVINWEKGRTQPAVRFVPDIVTFLGFDPRCQGASFGDRLRTARHGLGLSQRQLAQSLRVDAGTVRGWETERHRPSDLLLARVVALLSDARIGTKAPEVAGSERSDAAGGSQDPIPRPPRGSKRDTPVENSVRGHGGTELDSREPR
jgi:DNA-binding XRE family transcriptional regulator